MTKTEQREELVQRDKNIKESKSCMIYFRRQIHFQDAAYFFSTSPSKLNFESTQLK